MRYIHLHTYTHRRWELLVCVGCPGWNRYALVVLMTWHVCAHGSGQVMWKSQVKLKYPNKQDYQKFMGNYSTIMGATTFVIIFFGSQIVKTFGMKVRAFHVCWWLPVYHHARDTVVDI